MRGSRGIHECFGLVGISRQEGSPPSPPRMLLSLWYNSEQRPYGTGITEDFALKCSDCKP